MKSNYASKQLPINKTQP